MGCYWEPRNTLRCLSTGGDQVQAKRQLQALPEETTHPSASGHQDLFYTHRLTVTLWWAPEVPPAVLTTGEGAGRGDGQPQSVSQLQCHHGARTRRMKNSKGLRELSSETSSVSVKETAFSNTNDISGRGNYEIAPLWDGQLGLNMIKLFANFMQL